MIGATNLEKHVEAQGPECLDHLPFRVEHLRLKKKPLILSPGDTKWPIFYSLVTFQKGSVSPSQKRSQKKLPGRIFFTKDFRFQSDIVRKISSSKFSPRFSRSRVRDVASPSGVGSSKSLKEMKTASILMGVFCFQMSKKGFFWKNLKILIHWKWQWGGLNPMKNELSL